MARIGASDTGRGTRLQQLREEAGLSRDGLAALALIGASGKRNGKTVGDWEAGCNGTVDGLMRIVGALAAKLRRPKGELLVYVLVG